METEEENKKELIRLFVVPNMTESEFHEVSPEQLNEYLNECKEKKKAMHRRNVYHELAIMAKVDKNTTDDEMNRLLRSEVRTLFIQTKCNKPEDAEQIFLKVNTAIDRFYMENNFRTPIGVAIEINGEQLTLGRMRNDTEPFVDVGHIMVLTTNEDYRYCSLKEIVYVSNLWRYLEVLKLGDIVRIEDQIVAKVVKCGYLRPVTVEVMQSGYLSSFMNVKIPHYIETKTLEARDIAEVDNALKFGPNFLVVSDIKNSAYLSALKGYIHESIKIIGSINFEYIEKKFLDIADYIMHVEAIWFENLFLTNMRRQISNMISESHLFDKATIGTIPLRTCSDYKKLENHDRVKQMDCLLIEKSSVRKKYPLIAKKLLPVGNKKINVPPMSDPSCGEGIVNFVLRTIYLIPCQGIVVSSECPKAALAFAIPQIYCPVICVVPDDATGRLLNLRRNLKPVVSETATGIVEFGISFGRQSGILKTGDFVISITECSDNNSQVCINLRAFYLPPTAIISTPIK